MKSVAIAFIVIFGLTGSILAAEKEPEINAPVIEDGDSRVKTLSAQLQAGDAQAAVALSDISDGLFEGGDKKEAVNILQLLANQTVNQKVRGTALLRLGLLNQLGQYFIQDFNIAAHFYNLIADDPDMNREIKLQALYNLGLLYFYGSANFERNYDQAFNYFEEVAAQAVKGTSQSAAYIDLQYKLATLYLMRNKLEQAILLLKEVSENVADPFKALGASHLLAQIFINENRWDQAYRYLDKLYNQNIDPQLVVWAAKQLAFMYAGNEYVQRDLHHAESFARFVIENDNADYDDRKIMTGLLRRLGLEKRERNIQVRKPGVVTKENPK